MVGSKYIESNFSHIHVPENVSYVSEYPTHVQGHYKLKPRLEMAFN